MEESGLDVPADKLIELGTYKSENSTSRCHYKFYVSYLTKIANSGRL